MLNTNEPVYQKITEIARIYGIFDCIPCARSIKEFLIDQGIHGQQIKLDTGSQDPLYGRIYDDSIGELIATTGHHEGIAIEIDGIAIVFDNIHYQGIPKSIWMQNLYSPILEVGQEFKVTEVVF